MIDFETDLIDNQSLLAGLNLGSSIRGTLSLIENRVNGLLISHSLDSDYYYIYLGIGDSYVVSLLASAASAGRAALGDPLVIVRDEQGNIVAQNDNANALTLNSNLTFTTTTGGFYTVEVRSARETRSIFSTDPALEPGDYVLQFYEVGQPTPPMPPLLHLGTGGNDTMTGHSLLNTFGLEGDDVITGVDPLTIPSGLFGGSTITIPGHDNIYGGAGNDRLYGNGDDDFLRGGTGQDWIYGGTGNDMLYGGDAFPDIEADSLYGGDGNDSILGGYGDEVGGGAGDDVITVFDGNNRIWGGYGSDSIYAGGGNDTIYGGPGANYIEAWSGNDFIVGGDDGNYIEGGNGDDTIRGGTGNDLIGTDPGHIGNDNIGGGAGNDTIFGGSGNHTIWGGLGNDEIYGGNGNTLIYGGPGSDILQGDAGNDSIYGGNNGSTLVGGLGNDLIRGGSGNDLIDASPGDDNVGGGAGNDQIYCWQGNNTVWGGLGNDTITGGTGRDLLYGGSGRDVFVFTSATHIGIGAGRDVIADFTPGVDRLDLSALSQVFNGSAGLIGSGVASFFYHSGTGLLIGDDDGDGIADWVLQFTGAPTLTAGDFLL